MSTEPRTIVIERPPEAETSVAGLGRVVLGRPGRPTGYDLTTCARRPHGINYRAFANAVVAGALRPSVPPSVIDGLSAKDRHRLMFTLVRLLGDEADWRKLYGTQLSTDERFFAVTLWHWERGRKDLRQRLRRIRGENARSAHIVAQRFPKALNRSSLSKAVFPMKGYDQLFKSSALAVFSKPNVLLGANNLVSSTALATLVGRPGTKAIPLLANRMKTVSIGSDVASALRRPSALQALDRAAFSGLGDNTRVARQLGAALQRPLLDGRMRALLDPVGTRSVPDMVRARSALSMVHTRSVLDMVRTRSVVGMVSMPEFNALARVSDILKPTRGMQALAEFGRFMREWESDPLWFLLSVFGMRGAHRFVGLTRDEVEQLLLKAMAELVRDGEFTPALRKVLEDAPHLTQAQRDYLDHALEHAEAGEWRQAVLPLLAGLEGALHSAAVAQSLIVAAGGKFMAAEKLVKRMAIDEDYTHFVVRRVYGGDGNAFRHGRAEDGERDQVLLGIVALAGWVDYFMQLNAMRVLVTELSKRVDDAIDQGNDGAPLLPAPS